MGRATQKVAACRVCGKEYLTAQSGSLRCAQCYGRATREKGYEVVRCVKLWAQCVLCGEIDPIVLQFHHVDPDTKWRHEKYAGTPNQAKGVSGLIGKNRSWRRVVEELEKCVPLCANCHLRVEAGESDVTGIPLLKVPLECYWKGEK